MTHPPSETARAASRQRSALRRVGLPAGEWHPGYCLDCGIPIPALATYRNRSLQYTCRPCYEKMTLRVTARLIETLWRLSR